MNISKKILALILAITLLTSCDKSYQYVEIVHEKNILGELEVMDLQPEIIKAEDDSSAYISAYRRFYISVAFHSKLTEPQKSFSTPLFFKLINEDGKDIVITTYSKNREIREKEKEIRDQVNSSLSGK